MIMTSLFIALPIGESSNEAMLSGNELEFAVFDLIESEISTLSWHIPSIYI
jgi:hypothetical protein